MTGTEYDVVAAQLSERVGAMLDENRLNEALAAAAEATDIVRWAIAIGDPAGPVLLDRALHDLAAVQLRLGRFDEAVTVIEERLAFCRAPVIAGLVRPDADLWLAQALDEYREALRALDRYSDAAAAMEELAAAMRRLTATDPGSYGFGLAVTLNNLASQCSELGDLDRAAGPAAESADLFLAQVAEPSSIDADAARALVSLSEILRASGAPDRAFEASRAAAEVWRRLADDDPNRFPPEFGVALTQQAGHLSTTGRLAEAHALLGEAANVFRHLSTEQPRHDFELATVLRNLSALSTKIGDPDASLTAAREAVHVARRLGRDESWAQACLADCLNSLAVAMLRTGEAPAALPVTTEAVEIYRRLADRHKLALVLWTSAEIREAAGLELSQALAAIDESITLYEEFAAESAGYAAEVAGAHGQRERILKGLANQAQ
jgi:tetratricopeptide (TPR) repeat protein